MLKNRAFTLVELMVVVGLFSILMVAMLGILVSSDTYWSKGQNKITEQLEARKAIEGITKELMLSNTYWNITIDTNKILFYKPVFNSTGYKTGTHWVIFKPDPADAKQLIRKEEGDTDWSAVAYDLESLVFNGSSDNCVTFTSTTVPSTCPMVKVTVTTKKDKAFSLSSLVNLRNQLIINETVELPEEGEF
jgi:prepilin-type N-terminal cleavage/methylation domain-containing protein